MNQKLKLGIGILVLALGILAIGCKNTSTKEKAKTEKEMAEVIYTCTMHPEVEKKEPGNCPECGMTLVKKKSEMKINHGGHPH